MKKIIKSAVIVFIALFLSTVFSGCSRSSGFYDGSLVTQSPFATFQDIPGITAQEIADIEHLQQTREALIYGMIISTEAFIQEDGKIGGYAALFCEWLTELFGIPFVPSIFSSQELFSMLDDGEIDFSGNMMFTPPRAEIYNMTDNIAERQLLSIKKPGTDLNRIAQERPIRYVFIQNSPMESLVAGVVDPGSYEPSWVANYPAAYEALANGEADAFIAANIAHAFFIGFDVVIEDFFPLLFSSVTMAAAKTRPELESVISVVTKAQRNGALPFMTYMYNKGYNAFRRHAIFSLFDEEERTYIASNPVIPVAAFRSEYPLSFWNTRDREWQGIFFDVLDEVTALTGLTFDVVPDEQAVLFPNLTRTQERADRYIWSEHNLLDDQLALISKSDFRNISINEILHVTVGLARNTIYTDMFNQWFPNHRNTVMFNNMDEAVEALINDNVQMVMAGQRRVLQLTHFQEQPGYKINVAFGHPLVNRITFRNDEDILRSIIDKSLNMVYIDGISTRWVQRTYDYRAMLFERQRPWFIGAILLVFVILLLLLNMVVRNNKHSHLLEAANKIAEDRRVEAETANKTKSEFLSHISHEIRTPMNAILGTAEIQLQRKSVPPEISEAFHMIYGSGNLLLNIINDILDLSKIEAGKLEILAVPYDIPSIIYDTVQLCLLRFESKSIEFKLNIAEDTPHDLIGDELRIKQILSNILSNAFKYTDRGSVTLSVAAEMINADNIILILNVKDTGQGMTAEQVKMLFEEYTRFNLDANRTIVGTGLGMHITKRLTDTMDGEIYVESEPGNGSEFTVRLPQKRIGTDVCGKDLAKKLSGSPFRNKMMNRSHIIHEYMPYGRVLVVDDVESNLYVAKGMLLPYGLDIETAVNGFDAVEKIRNGNVYDIIFMDHMMPKMNGLEATKLIRDLNYKQPIVALTANAVVGSSEMFLANGFDGFISKPIDIRELNTSLNRLIRDKQPPEIIKAAREQIKEQTSADESEMINKELIKAVVKDLENALPILEDILPRLDHLPNEELLLFTTLVHGMKSGFANIGEIELSDYANKLEQAGNNGDLDAIASEMTNFIKALKRIIEKNKPENKNESAEVSPADKTYLKEKLAEIKTACEKIKKKEAKAALDDLKQKLWTRETNNLLEELADCLLKGEFKKVSILVDTAME
jgi:signal transduction histidine kinase/CheY-like chemotaxis protein